MEVAQGVRRRAQGLKWDFFLIKIRNPKSHIRNPIRSLVSGCWKLNDQNDINELNDPNHPNDQNEQNQS